MYLVLSALTSSPISLVAATKAYQDYITRRIPGFPRKSQNIHNKLISIEDDDDTKMTMITVGLVIST